MKLEKSYKNVLYATGRFVRGRKQKHYYLRVDPEGIRLDIAFYDSYRRCSMLQGVAYIKPTERCELLQTFWEELGLSSNKRIIKEHARLWETLKEQEIREEAK
jgi:hypothetical protein